MQTTKMLRVVHTIHGQDRHTRDDITGMLNATTSLLAVGLASEQIPSEQQC